MTRYVLAINVDDERMRKDERFREYIGDRKAFIDALNLNPGDVTTRLVYADWLDEHGEPDEANRQRGMVTTPVTVDL